MAIKSLWKHKFFKNVEGALNIGLDYFFVYCFFVNFTLNYNKSHDPMTNLTYTVRLWMFAIAMLLLPSLNYAQVDVAASNHTVLPDETFSVDIIGIEFNNILGMQFSVAWDSAAFEFVEITNVNEALANAPLNPFGLEFTENGNIGFQWVDFALSGISLGDTAVLFSVTLKTIEDESGVYAFGFTDFPTTVEIADTDENILEVNFIEGAITIDGINSGLLEQKASEYVEITNHPNPFARNTTVSMNWIQAADVQLTILSPVGEVCFQKKASFHTGLHQLNLSEELFSQAGVYLLRIKSTDFIATYKLIAI
jgi:hypothetical protein